MFSSGKDDVFPQEKIVFSETRKIPSVCNTWDSFMNNNLIGFTAIMLLLR